MTADTHRGRRGEGGDTWVNIRRSGSDAEASQTRVRQAQVEIAFNNSDSNARYDSTQGTTQHKVQLNGKVNLELSSTQSRIQFYFLPRNQL